MFFFFFVDLGCTTKEEKAIYNLLQLVTLAVEMKWHVVVSTSSGGGWDVPGHSLESVSISQCLKRMCSYSQVLTSKNFTDKEADVYINKFEIDKEKLEKDIETGNNPRILYMFAYTSSPTICDTAAKYQQSMLSYQSTMTKLAQELLSVMERKEFDLCLKNFLQWLEYARHNVPLNDLYKPAYMASYVHAEHLTYYTEENENQFSIKLHIPSMYAYLVRQLKIMYRKKQSNVHNIL